MNLICALKQLNVHLRIIKERGSTDNFQLNKDITNLSNSEMDQDLEEQDPAMITMASHLYSLIDSSYAIPKSFDQLLIIMDKLMDNEVIRHLLQEFEFIPLLSNILQCDETKEPPLQEKILNVLEKLTKNVKIYSPEFYLISLIPYLVDTVVSGKEVDDKIPQLSLCILVNLCESRPVIDTMVKVTSTKQLLKKIGTGPELTKIKLVFLIDCYYKTPSNFQLAIVVVFEEIQRAIAANDLNVIEDCFSFVQKFAADAMEACRGLFLEKLQNLLDALINILTSSSQGMESIISSGLKLFASLVANDHSLNLTNHLLNFTLDCLSADPLFRLESLQLLQALGDARVEFNADNVDRLNNMWPQINKWMEKETKTEKILVILRVFQVFAQLDDYQSNILQSVNRSTLQHLIESHMEPNIMGMKDQKILLILTLLELLVIFSAADALLWYGEAEKTMKLPGVAEIIAEGFSRKNKTMFQSGLNLLKFGIFLEQKVVQLVHRFTFVKCSTTSSPLLPEDKFTPKNILMEQSTRMNEILNAVSEGNHSKSSIGLLIQYQDAFANLKTRWHEEEMNEAARKIAKLKQERMIMETERTHMRSIICQQETTCETKTLAIEKCEETIANQCKSMNVLMEKIDQMKNIEEALVKKTEECEQYETKTLELKFQVKELRDLFTQQQNEMAKLQERSEYSQKINEEMKKDIAKKNNRIQQLEDKVKEMEKIKEKISNLVKF